MKITDQDRAAGFKEIRVALLSGRFEIVRVSVEKSERLSELFIQKPPPVKAFIGAAIGRDVDFVEQIDPHSIHEIFVAVMGLLGAENLMRNTMKQVGEKLLKEAEAETE